MDHSLQMEKKFIASMPDVNVTILFTSLQQPGNETRGFSPKNIFSQAYIVLLEWVTYTVPYCPFMQSFFRHY
jgi:hypothetical protein